MGTWPGDSSRERTTFGGLNRGTLMARVRSIGNKTTEERLASLLRQNKLSGWRRHLRLAGKPDFIWPSERVAVFVDGCFWHGHDCGRNLTPKTNTNVWREKIRRNKARDGQASRLLRREGWVVIRIWECELAKNPMRVLVRIVKAIGHELRQRPVQFKN